MTATFLKHFSLALIVSVLFACSHKQAPANADASGDGHIEGGASRSSKTVSNALPTLIDPLYLLNHPEQFSLVAAKAADGDAEAASAVVEYYAMVKVSETAEFEADYNFWFQVAVENGSALWIDTKAKMLAETSNEYRSRRAVYLERRAAVLQPETRERFEKTIESFKSICPSLKK